MTPWIAHPPFPVGGCGSGRAARRGVERRGRRELKERRGLLVDLHDRELTRCAKRYEERVSAHAQGVRLIVPHARRRVERQRSDRARNRTSEVRHDYLVTMWRCSEPHFLVRAHVEAVPIGSADRASVDERVRRGIQTMLIDGRLGGETGRRIEATSLEVLAEVVFQVLDTLSRNHESRVV